MGVVPDEDLILGIDEVQVFAGDLADQGGHPSGNSSASILHSRPMIVNRTASYIGTSTGPALLRTRFVVNWIRPNRRIVLAGRDGRVALVSTNGSAIVTDRWSPGPS